LYQTARPDRDIAALALAPLSGRALAAPAKRRKQQTPPPARPVQWSAA
jgi:hypothetical protein